MVRTWTRCCNGHVVHYSIASQKFREAAGDAITLETVAYSHVAIKTEKDETTKTTGELK